MVIFSMRKWQTLFILSIVVICLVYACLLCPPSFGVLRGLATSNPMSSRNPVIVIGILSAEQNVCFRNAQRQMFVTEAKAYTSLDIKVFFLLDNATPILEEERLIHNDIFYFNSTVHGWNKEFAKKLFSWYSFVARNFPDAILVGRMDDDVFSCVPQMFDRLYEIMDPFLYYGFRINVPTRCPPNDCVDDMFVFVGMELVRRIVRGRLCVDDNIKNCSPDGLAWQRLREWILPFNNETKIVHDNSKFIFFFDRKKENPKSRFNAEAKMKALYRKNRKSFCKNYLLFHKASVKYIYQMNKENAFELGELKRVETTEEDMMKADKCLTK